MAGYTRWSAADRDVQLVAITSVDPISGQAAGMTRIGTTVMIDVNQHVGAVELTPARGEQWYAERWKGTWRLCWRVSNNDAKVLTEPVEGQVRFGSSGPLELNGSVVAARAPLGFLPVTTAGRPDPAAAGEGAAVYDVDLHIPVWSDGAAWRDALGNAV